MDSAYVIENSKAMPSRSCRGRPKGSGWNLRTLAKMKSGSSLWDIPKAKMSSIRNSAFRHGIKLKIRAIPDFEGNPSGFYAIEKL